MKYFTSTEIGLPYPIVEGKVFFGGDYATFDKYIESTTKTIKTKVGTFKNVIVIKEYLHGEEHYPTRRIYLACGIELIKIIDANVENIIELTKIIDPK